MKLLKKISKFCYDIAPEVIGILAVLMMFILMLTGAMWSVQLFIKVLG